MSASFELATQVAGANKAMTDIEPTREHNSAVADFHSPAISTLGHREIIGPKGSGRPSPGYQHDAVGSETILLVEDDTAVRMVIRRVLEKHGYDVIEAGDGIEALEICAAGIESVHLVLSDVVMPRMSGRVLFDRLNELARKPKVLMMSGYTDDEIERHGAFPQGTPFIAKPFSVAAMATRVREVLDGRA